METAPAKAIAPYLPTGRTFGVSLQVPSALAWAPSAARAKPSWALAIRTKPVRPGKIRLGERAGAAKVTRQARKIMTLGILEPALSRCFPCCGFRAPFFSCLHSSRTRAEARDDSRGPATI